jgi:hypothetical protein
MESLCVSTAVVMSTTALANFTVEKTLHFQMLALQSFRERFGSYHLHARTGPYFL